MQNQVSPRRADPLPFWEMAAKAIVNGGPGTCHFAITSICNARCDFCNFAIDRMPASARHAVTLEQANMTRSRPKDLTMGEPLAHRDFV